MIRYLIPTRRERIAYWIRQRSNWERVFVAFGGGLLIGLAGVVCIVCLATGGRS